MKILEAVCAPHPTEFFGITLENNKTIATVIWAEPDINSKKAMKRYISAWFNHTIIKEFYDDNEEL